MLQLHYNQLHVLLQMHLKPSQLTNAEQSSAGNEMRRREEDREGERESTVRERLSELQKQLQ